MDESFRSFDEILAEMLSFSGDLTDEQAGIRFYIDECTIESPVELGVYVDDQGAVKVGSSVPLYDVDTTFRPALHQLRFTARRKEDSDGE